MDDEEMSPDEIAALVAAALEETEEVQPAPWSNSDTTAVSMMFAANLSLAAADMFRNLARLALGQSAHDWAEADDRQFNDSVMRSLGLIPEAKEGDDGGSGRLSSPE